MNSSESQKAKGKKGEQQAVKYLKKQKYKIVETNFQCPFGEIDIIALKGRTLVFIEVKTRHTLECGPPEESVGFVKQRHIAKAAQYYINKKRIAQMEMRFDVVSIYSGSDAIVIDLIPNAFESPL